VLSSLWVPGRPIGNPQVVSFNLGRGVVPRGRPVAGQLSGTLLRAGLTNLESVCCFLVLDSVTSTNPVLGSRGLSPSRSPALQLGPQGVVDRKSRGGQPPSDEHLFARSTPPGQVDLRDLRDRTD